jgi:Resolvase, N terminal domain
LFEHLIEAISKLNNRKNDFKSIQENIDSTTAGGKLVFHIFGALAEFERILSGRERMLDCKKQKPGNIISADRYKSKENPGFSSSQSVRNFSVPTGTPLCMDDGETTNEYIPLYKQSKEMLFGLFV